MYQGRTYSEAKHWLFCRLPDLEENNLALVVFEDLSLFVNELPDTCKYWRPIVIQSSHIFEM